MAKREVNPLLADVVEDFAKDSEKENKGVWMPFKRFEYLVARAHRNNTKFLKTMEEKMRPYQWALDRGNMNALRDVANDVMQEVYAETILLGIRRIDTKEPLPYTVEDGVALFNRLPDLWDEIFKFATSTEPYSPAQIKDDSGN